VYFFWGDFKGLQGWQRLIYYFLNMDPEYERKKALMDWIVAKLAGRHYPKPEVPDKTAVAPPQPKQEPVLNKSGEILTGQKLRDRMRLFFDNPNQAVEETKKTFWRTHGDVLKERLGEFDGRERMGDSLDSVHNSAWNILYNKRHKDELREAFEKLGYKRKN